MEMLHPFIDELELVSNIPRGVVSRRHFHWCTLQPSPHMPPTTMLQDRLEMLTSNANYACPIHAVMIIPSTFVVSKSGMIHKQILLKDTPGNELQCFWHNNVSEDSLQHLTPDLDAPPERESFTWLRIDSLSNFVQLTREITRGETSTMGNKKESIIIGDCNRITADAGIVTLERPNESEIERNELGEQIRNCVWYRSTIRGIASLEVGHHKHHLTANHSQVADPVAT